MSSPVLSNSKRQSLKNSDQDVQIVPDRTNSMRTVDQNQIFPYHAQNLDFHTVQREEISSHHSHERYNNVNQFGYDIKNANRDIPHETVHKRSHNTSCNARPALVNPVTFEDNRDVVREQFHPPKSMRLHEETISTNRKIIESSLVASSDETKSPQETSTLDGNAKKKEPPRPTRPRSAYNYFFQEQRRIILGLPLDEDEDNGSKKEKKKSDSSVDENSKKPRGRPRGPNYKKRNPPHGMIDFFSLAKTIGPKWKALDNEEKVKYNARADKDKIRYIDEMKIFHKKLQHMENSQKESTVTRNDYDTSENTKRINHANQYNKRIKRKNELNASTTFKHAEFQTMSQAQGSCNMNEPTISSQLNKRAKKRHTTHLQAPSHRQHMHAQTISHHSTGQHRANKHPTHHKASLLRSSERSHINSSCQVPHSNHNKNDSEVNYYIKMWADEWASNEESKTK